MKIAIIVHGRWDAFELARNLDARGHDVALMTNYPASAVESFGVPRRLVRSFGIHGVLCRAVSRVGLESVAEELLHQAFGRWAAGQSRAERWDVVYAFSGVAEECFRALAGSTTLRVLVRESAHIRVQDALLREEEQRTGIAQQRPSAWRIAREEREYGLADVIRVLSTFTYQSFLAQGTPTDRLALVLSGAPVEKFRPAAGVVEARIRRLRAGEPLRVLTVGAVSLRKGIWDMRAVIRELGTRAFRFRFVGPVLAEAAPLARELERAQVEFIAKQPEVVLPDSYAWGDVFALPSIEDGFQAVLAQAAACGLPILTTPNGAGHDLVHDGRTGWVLPIRSPAAIIDRLRWADTHRLALAAMASDIYARYQPRDFGQVAADLEALFQERMRRPGLVSVA